MKKKFSREDIINLLIKQASGYYYKEEQYEYEKTQKSTNNNKISNNFIQNENNLQFFDRGKTQVSFFDDIVKMSDETEQIHSNKTNENLALSKKKVATHFVSPDMQAIKLLLEIFNDKVSDNNIQNLSDEELLALKNKLIGELLNEPNKNQ